MSAIHVMKPVIYAALLTAIVVGAMAMWSAKLGTNVTVQTGTMILAFKGNSVNVQDPCGVRSNDYNATLGSDGSLNITRLDKDVACTSAVLLDKNGDGYYDTMNVTIHNAYPWYYSHISFIVYNPGTVPLKIWKVVIDGHTIYARSEGNGVPLDLNGDGKPDVMVWWGDNFGSQLDHNGKADISLYIVVLETAPQHSTLTFQIEMYGVQWNGYNAVVPSGSPRA